MRCVLIGGARTWLELTLLRPRQGAAFGLHRGMRVFEQDKKRAAALGIAGLCAVMLAGCGSARQHKSAGLGSSGDMELGAMDAEAAGRTCRSSLDCDSAGAWCKDRGDGVRVCVTDDDYRAECHSNMECGLGKTCAHRGDGHRECMGEGAPGASCRDAADCQRGLFCQGRGDGRKTCL